MYDFSQDTAFPLTERDRLGLRGLLPPRVMSFEQQYERFSEKSFLFNLRFVSLLAEIVLQFLFFASCFGI